MLFGFRYAEDNQSRRTDDKSPNNPTLCAPIISAFIAFAPEARSRAFYTVAAIWAIDPYTTMLISHHTTPESRRMSPHMPDFLLGSCGFGENRAHSSPLHLSIFPPVSMLIKGQINALGVFMFIKSTLIYYFHGLNLGFVFEVICISFDYAVYCEIWII